MEDIKKLIRESAKKMISEGYDERYERIVYMQGDDADEALNILNNNGVDAALEHLKQWHYPGEHEGSNEIGNGTSDKTYNKDGYIMMYNLPLNYIGLVYDTEHDNSGAMNEDIGKKFKVSDGSGLDSNKVVTIVDKSNIKTDGRGVPTNVKGAYKPVDWSKEHAFQYDDGSYGTMFKNRLQPVANENDAVIDTTKEVAKDSENEQPSYKVKLMKISQLSRKIAYLMEDGELPAWIQDKITEAKHHMEAIDEYMMGIAFADDEPKNSEDQVDEVYDKLGEGRGLWDNIRAKRERGEPPAKKGDKDYPKAKQWKKLTKEKK